VDNLEGTGRTVHEPTVWRNADGLLTIDWHGKQLEPGDRILMSAEVFAECIRAMNQLQSMKRALDERKGNGRMKSINYGRPVSYALGVPVMWKCPLCGCPVLDQTLHTEFHMMPLEMADALRKKLG